MDQPKFPNGLKEAMDALGMGPTKLAKLIGDTKQNVDRWAKWQRKLKPEDAERIAPHVNRTAAQLLLLSEATEPPTLTIPHISWISAGAMMHDDVSDEAIGKIDVARLPDGDWFALTVRGDSMDRISPPDSIILVNRKDKRLVANACYIIDDGEGNATYKRFRPDPMRFEPVSTNPAHEPLFPDNEPTVIGRVKRSMIDM